MEINAENSTLPIIRESLTDVVALHHCGENHNHRLARLEDRRCPSTTKLPSRSFLILLATLDYCSPFGTGLPYQHSI
jgi:hypothetical protein